MNPVFLQKQIRDNATDLQDFYKEISEWGEEMKQKDKLLSSKQKHEVDKKESRKKPRKEKITEKKSRIQGLDYSSWDKYDVEAECAKLDEDKYKHDSSSDGSEDLSDEFDEQTREQAILEKEKGNKFVKSQMWDEAILCYTQAIKYYGYDPIFYANRALCHLKKQNFKAAESDCTVALQLDKTYVKAYQRRAAAREKLGQLQQAHDDLLKVFDYESNNKESKAALARIEKLMKNCGNRVPSSTETTIQRPKSKFTISRSKQKEKVASSLQPQEVTQLKQVFPIESEKSDNEKDIKNIWFDKKDVEIVHPVIKPAHLRSTKALKRVEIRETSGLKKFKESTKNKKAKNESSFPFVGENSSLICDNLRVIERKVTECDPIKTTNITQESQFETKSVIDGDNKLSFSVPQTSVQFLGDWTKLKNDSENRCRYLKNIKASNLPNIFKFSLESDIFSDILKTIADGFIGEESYEYLMAITKVKRFATLAMFMTPEDKKCVNNVIERLKSSGLISNDQIDNLIKKYEID
ncbi:RNA polymerase II-associated protein 3 [Agrilus planipennis]|uniref:RNA polymerase II-associated protein 3 n=1 Tax=Agrilus planipennis TaxID=224129 RepID=A0A1W4WM04_AGRPL|nr:RNA polymerase II-associated protein 3 [Agrilus planipennis]